MSFPIVDSNPLLNGSPLDGLAVADDLIDIDDLVVTLRTGPMSSLGTYFLQRDDLVQEYPSIGPISLRLDDPDSDRVLSFDGGRLTSTDLDESGMLVQVLEFDKVA